MENFIETFLLGYIYLFPQNSFKEELARTNNMIIYWRKGFLKNRSFIVASLKKTQKNPKLLADVKKEKIS